MREILFRGKNADGEWVSGYAVKGCDKDNQMFIAKSIGLGFFTGGVSAKEVISETIGQFTGLCDKNGTKIFEGDIIHIECGCGSSAFVGNGIVFFDEKRLQFRVKSVEPSSFDSEKGNIYDECDFTVICSYKVMGNIYDNPELIPKE